MAEALLERGAPTDPVPPNGAGTLSYVAHNFGTPLHAAARRGDAEMVSLLLKYGARPDTRCCDGDTALGYAAGEGHVQVVQLLLDAGADPTLGSHSGTPLEVARRVGHQRVVELLETAAKGTGR